MENATGKSIGFIDSYDYIDNKLYLRKKAINTIAKTNLWKHKVKKKK